MTRTRQRPGGETGAQATTGRDVGTEPTPTCRLCPLPSCGYPPCRLDLSQVDGVCRVVDVYCELVEAVSGRG